MSDVSVGYALALANDWTLTPKVGVTYVRTARDWASEAGGPFALTVARDRHVTGFTDAGVTFARSETSDAVLRPYIEFGARTRIDGKRGDAIAGYAGAPLMLTAAGAPRAQLPVLRRLESRIACRLASNCSRRSRRRPAATITGKASRPVQVAFLILIFPGSTDTVRYLVILCSAHSSLR